MSENGNNRPRRAMDPEEEFGLEDPSGPDDTPVDLPSPARRGAGHSTGPDPDEPATQQTPDAQAPVTDDGQVNPFARPGSQSAALPASSASAPRSTSPVLPETEGRRGGGISYDDSRPVPRRSAVSSITPPDPDVMIPAPTPGVTGAVGSSGTPGQGLAASSRSGTRSWLDHHRKSLAIWIIGALVAAIVIGTGFYLAGRTASPEPSESGGPVISPSQTSPEPSGSPVPEASVEDLMTVEDADLLTPGASWVVTATAEERSAFESVATCLTGDDGAANTLVSLQRTLGTSDADHLAALHQIDVFATVETAQQVQAGRLAQLAACDQVPVLISSSTSVTGLADEVSQLTVIYENAPAEVHSVWLLRTGRALTVVDVVRDSVAVDPSAVAAGIQRSLSGVCERAEGACPSTPAFAAVVPPASPPAGWLLTSDLPRISRATGQWTATAPTQLTSGGMGCENLPLATEPGPATRAQRTYLLIQDPNRPDTFGVDEMVFDFNAPGDAAAFVSKLGGNLASCKDRVLTATVTEHDGVTGTGVDGSAISSRLFTIQQATSDTSSVIYQLSVAVSGTKVSYLLTSVTEEFKFTEAQFASVALRAGQRLTQS